MPSPNTSASSSALKQVRNFSSGVLIARGILGILIGIILLFAPVVGAAALALFVGVLLAIWLLVDGIGAIIGALQQRKVQASRWGWDLAFGILAVIAGIIIFFAPTSAGIFLGLIFLWMLVFGLLFGGIASIGAKWTGTWGTVAGVLNIVFAVLFIIMLIASPGGTIVAATLIAGVYGIFTGILSIVTAVQLRKITR